MLAAPLNIASAIATRTKRMKIGIAVQVLPLCHPLRIAEEATTVDHISHGRLIFGVGRSGFPRTYQAYGISYAESRERFAEVLEILKRAWTQETFSFHGKFYHFDNVYLVPKPFQAPYPEMRVAVNSPDTFQQSGEPGKPIFVATRLGDLDELVPNLARLPRSLGRRRSSRQRQGLSARAGLHRRDRTAGARGAERERHVLLPLPRRADRGLGRAWKAPARSRTGPSAAQRLQTIDYEEVLRSKIIVGTPAMVVDRLGRAEGDAGPVGHPGGAELRHAHSARAGVSLAAADVRAGHATFP